MSVVIRLKVPIEMHYTVIPMGTSKVNSSPAIFYRLRNLLTMKIFSEGECENGGDLILKLVERDWR